MPTTAVRWTASALARTWRTEIRDEHYLASLRRDRKPFIFALWHGQLLPLLWHHRGFPTALVVSQHADGRHLAAVAKRWGYRIIPGSSTRDGDIALRQMRRVLRDGGEVAITPDGPRGPGREVKHGAIAMAQWTEVPIIPVTADATSRWQLRSWDGFVVPKPGSRIAIRYHAPFTVRPGRPAREMARTTLERTLNGDPAGMRWS